MNWNSSALCGLIGLFGGIVVASFFYFIGLRRKSLIYDISTTTLISDDVSQVLDLDIKYKNKEIGTLYASVIRITNIGNIYIEPTDFIQSSQLSLITKGEFLLNADNSAIIIFRNNTVYNSFPLISLTEDNICKEISLNFDYIPKNSQIICSVFHTDEIKVSGILKDGKIKPIEQNHERYDKIFIFEMGIISGCILTVIVTLLFKTFT